LLCGSLLLAVQSVEDDEPSGEGGDEPLTEKEKTGPGPVEAVDQRARRQSARTAAAAPSTASRGMGRQQPQPPIETSDPRRVRVETKGTGPQKPNLVRRGAPPDRGRPGPLGRRLRRPNNTRSRSRRRTSERKRLTPVLPRARRPARAGDGLWWWGGSGHSWCGPSVVAEAAEQNRGSYPGSATGRTAPRDAPIAHPGRAPARASGRRATSDGGPVIPS
jgi:hypothetical protein